MATIKDDVHAHGYQQCDWCGEVAYVASGQSFIICDNCKCDQGDRVECNVAPLGKSAVDHNTQFIQGVLMKPWQPGEDLLLECDGMRLYYEAHRVYNVYRVGVN